MSGSNTTQPALNARECEISAHECRAMRQLDRDGDYSRSEISFLFECKVPTVARHADRECRHNGPRDTTDHGPGNDYSEIQCKTAYRLVYDEQPYQRMSQEVYREHRPDEFPSVSVIRKRFGSWPAAREAVWGDER